MSEPHREPVPISALPLVAALTNEAVIPALQDGSTVGIPVGDLLPLVGGGAVAAAQASAEESATNAAAAVVAQLAAINAQLAAEAAAADALLYSPVINVQKFGASSTATETVNTDAFLAALAELGSNPGTLYVPYGSYPLALGFEFPAVSQRIIGDGAGMTSNLGPGDGKGAELLFSHTNGPSLKFRGSHSGAMRLRISATAARTAAGIGAGSNLNSGIMEEPPDTLGSQINGNVYDQLVIRGQPADALDLIGLHMDALVSRCFLIENGRHGLVVDNGMMVGRANRSRPGAVTVASNRLWDNGGHSFAIGNTDELNNLAYRIDLINNDTFRNADNAAMRRSDHAAWFFAESSNFWLNGFGGSGAGNVAARIGLLITGRDCWFLNNRFIGCLNNAIEIVGHALLSSIGITVDHLLAAGNPAPFDPAVKLAATGVSCVHVNIPSKANIAYPVTPGIPGCTGRMAGLMYSGLPRSSEIFTINDGAAKSIEFTGITEGMLTLTSSSTGRKAADVHFRVGDASGFCQIMPHGTANPFGGVETSTGTLFDGAKGAGNLLLSASITSGDNRLYFQNRTGVAGNYCATARNLIGGWVKTPPT